MNYEKLPVTDDRLRPTEFFTFHGVKDVFNYTDGTCFRPRGDEHVSFVGERFADWESVQKRCSRVWAEGMYTLQQFIDRLSKIEAPALKSRKRVTEFSETEGDEVDVDRMRSGQPFWRSSKREDSVGSSQVTIFTDLTSHAKRKTSDILWRGASAIALTKVLEDKGYQVELWVVDGCQLYSQKPNDRQIVGVKVKGCGDPLDMSTLVNTVSGWYFRTAEFTLYDTIGRKLGQKIKPNYGNECPATPKELNHFSSDINRLYISGVWSFNGACDLIRDEIMKFKTIETKPEDN